MKKDIKRIEELERELNELKGKEDEDFSDKYFDEEIKKLKEEQEKEINCLTSEIDKLKKENNNDNIIDSPNNLIDEKLFVILEDKIIKDIVDNKLKSYFNNYETKIKTQINEVTSVINNQYKKLIESKFKDIFSQINKENENIKKNYLENMKKMNENIEKIKENIEKMNKELKSLEGNLVIKNIDNNVDVQDQNLENPNGKLICSNANQKGNNNPIIYCKELNKKRRSADVIGNQLIKKIEGINDDEILAEEGTINKPNNINCFQSAGGDSVSKSNTNTNLSDNNNKNIFAPKTQPSLQMRNAKSEITPKQKKYLSILKRTFFEDEFQQKNIKNEKINENDLEELKKEVLNDKKLGENDVEENTKMFIETRILPLIQENKIKSEDELRKVKYNIGMILKCLGLKENSYESQYYPKMKSKNERKNSQEEANRFRKEFGVGKDAITDEGLKRRLKNNNFSFEKTFQEIFD